jgi:FK506-binding protein 3
MSRGEKAKVIIEPEWGYGSKGLPEVGIPPNSQLIFEIILEDII